MVAVFALYGSKSYEMSKSMRIQPFTCQLCNDVQSGSSRSWWATCYYCQRDCCWTCMDEHFVCYDCDLVYRLQMTHISEEPPQSLKQNSHHFDWKRCFEKRSLSNNNQSWHMKIWLGWIAETARTKMGASIPSSSNSAQPY